MIPQIAAAALLLAQAAPTERPCITQEEAGDIAVSLLPYFIDAAAQQCRPHLAPNAFLSNGAAPWSSRLRAQSAPRRESALRGIGKVGGVAPPPGAEGDATFQFVALMLTGSIMRQIPPEDCVHFDTIARSLEPLAADNIARLITAALHLGVRDRPDEAEGAASAQTGAAAEGEPEDSEEDEPESGFPAICRS